MNEREKAREKRRLAENRRVRRVIHRMEIIKAAAEAGVDPDDDQFADEFKARLERLNDDGQWIRRNAVSGGQRRRFRNGFKPPRSWKSGEQKGLAILEKALLFMTTFRDRGIGFRQIHAIIMCAGRDAISIQEAADMSGVTYYAIRKALTVAEKAGFLKLTRIPRVGKQTPLCSVDLTPHGIALMRALNRFDPDKIYDYDRAVAMGVPHVPTKLRLLQMQQVMEDAKKTTETNEP